jgi:hypothetical protein
MLGCLPLLLVVELDLLLYCLVLLAQQSLIILKGLLQSISILLLLRYSLQQILKPILYGSSFPFRLISEVLDTVLEELLLLLKVQDG